MKLRCKRCQHEWNYNGKKQKKKYPTFVTCPNCLTSVALIKRISEFTEREFI